MKGTVERWGRRTGTLLGDAFALWSSANAFQHAGALAFYTLSSLAPLLIILISIISAVFGEDAARGEISGRLAAWVGADVAATVESVVSRSRLEEAGPLPTVMGVAALLFGSTTAFAQMQSSLNTLWGVAAKPSRSGVVVFAATRLTSLGVVLAIGFLLLTSLVISMAIGAALEFAEGWFPVPAALVASLDAGSSLLIAALLFGTIFKLLPDVHLQWRDMWFGAIVTAVLFVAGQSVLSLYLTRTATGSAFGAAGSVVMLLLWVYYSALILFFGAAMTRAAIRLRGSRITPKTTAVRVRLEVLEEGEAGTIVARRPPLGSDDLALPGDPTR